MILITMNHWIGPGRKMSIEESADIVSTETIMSFATELKLVEALARIIKHRQAYNEWARLAVNFKLISVSNIDHLELTMLQDLGVELVEDLTQEKEDYKNF